MFFGWGMHNVFLKHEGTSDWKTEFWGKWMHSCVPAYRYTHDEALKANIDASVKLVLSAQRADGYIGNYTDECHLQGWDIWGRKYTMLGLMHHYDLTGDKTVLDATRRVADQLITEVGPGAAGKIQTIGMHHGKRFETAPAYHMMETCVTTTWMRFCETLLRVTGKAAYADELEKTTYNAYLATLARDCSTFSKYCPLSGTRSRGNDQCGMTINCCAANGPRGFVAIAESALMADAEGVMVNLYHASKASIVLPASQTRVTVEQETDYPKGNKVMLRVSPDKEQPFALRLRIPAWSAKTSVTVNGLEVSGMSPGTYLSLNRTWKPGDTVGVTFDFTGRVEGKSEHFALFRGPLVLSHDARFNDGAVDQPAKMPELGKPVEITPVACENKDIWQAFTVLLQTGTDPESSEMKPHPVHFCDYGSAGNTWQADSLYRTWLRNPMNLMARPYVSYDVPGN